MDTGRTNKKSNKAKREGCRKYMNANEHEKRESGSRRRQEVKMNGVLLELPRKFYICTKRLSYREAYELSAFKLCSNGSISIFYANIQKTRRIC